MFDRIERLIGKENLTLIKNKSVLIVGLGGVGGSAILSLVRSGIGKVIIIDFDSVDISNINRQLIAFNDSVGRKKTDVCEEVIKNINPECEVVKYDIFLDKDNIIKILDDNNPDYVIDACDSVKTKQALIKACLYKKIKIISCMGTGNKLNPLDLEITDIRKTVNDPLARVIRNKFKNEKRKIMVVYSKEKGVKISDRTPGSTSLVPSVAGVMCASFVINDIMEVK